MIIYSKLGTKGNLGNQLFQIASTISIAKKNNHSCGFPEWRYSSSFINALPISNLEKEYKTIQEEKYEYNEIVLREGNYNLNGWFQSEKYFDRESVIKQFEFKPELIEKIKLKYRNELSKDHILISVRRGDFVNHPYYFQLDYKYYLLAITSQFSNWERRSLIFTSDDISYCKTHFSIFPNAVFIEKTTAIEQLVLGSLCTDFIISNSTFSWWLAWLGEKEDSKIIRPIQNFRGEFRLKNNDKDYFPERWVSFDFKKKRIGLKYSSLIFKAECLKLKNNIKYYFKLGLTKVKNNIKIIIGRK